MIDLRSVVAGVVLVVSANAAVAQEATPPAEPAVQAPSPPTVSASVTLTLDAVSDVESRTSIYQCDNGQGFRVQYVNAAPNFLAILPVDGQTYVFVTSLSASGARYVSGPYEWWSDGDEGVLRDSRTEGDDAPLATCLAASPTP